MAGDPDSDLKEEETNSLLDTTAFEGIINGTEMRHATTATRKIEDVEDEGDKQVKRMLSTFELFGLSIYWFGWSALMGPLLLVVIPKQVNILSRGSTSAKATALAETLQWGAIVALLTAPLAGSISDTSVHRWGRRSPFIATGLVLASFALLLMAVAPTLGFYSVAFLALSAANNISMSPYTALVPDLVPTKQRGAASAWLGIMAFMGTFVGGGITYYVNSIILVLFILGLVHAITGILTIQICRERPLMRAGQPPTMCRRLCYLFRPMFNHDFRVMFSTRFLMQLGILTIQEFLMYFLADVIGKDNFSLFGTKLADDSQQAVSILFLPLLFGAVASSCAAGIYADRTGKRKMVVYVSGGIMMFSCLLFSLICVVSFLRNFFMALIAALIFGYGYGAFSVIEWAMATDLLPNPEEFAKDMGIWSLALTLPQVVAGTVAGRLMEYLDPDPESTSNTSYSVVFLTAVVFFAIGIFYVKRIQSIS
ncbi:hypothetical protein AAMO2058_000595100 [Amorphochlora amoebiformis]